MRSVLLAWMVAVFSLHGLFAPTPAEAMCVGPSPRLAPDGETPLPARGVIYAFVPQAGSLDGHRRTGPELARGVTVAGAAYSADLVSAGPSYEVVRIRYEARAPQITVSVELGEYDLVATYAVGAASGVKRARIVDLNREKSRWTCSFTNTIELLAEGNAIAFRFDWEDGTTTIVPAVRSVFEREARGAAAADAELWEVKLGHPNCQGYNADPTALARLRTFRLRALYADGSEQPFPPARAMLDEEAVRLPFELLERGVDPRPVSEPDAPELLILVEEPGWHGALVVGLAGGAALLDMILVGALGRWLLRRRRDHVPRC